MCCLRIQMTNSQTECAISFTLRLTLTVGASSRPGPAAPSPLPLLPGRGGYHWRWQVPKNVLQPTVWGASSMAGNRVSELDPGLGVHAAVRGVSHTWCERARSLLDPQRILAGRCAVPRRQVLPGAHLSMHPLCEWPVRQHRGAVQCSVQRCVRSGDVLPPRDQLTPALPRSPVQPGGG